eukprot:Lithocolla_globosa_v1_NODE_4588_length_1405_cov_3.506667.p2 type:complete len:101 gc:universal NODE_4588_length_1405_cov_3.506667:379-681(+)
MNYSNEKKKNVFFFLLCCCSSSPTHFWGKAAMTMVELSTNPPLWAHFCNTCWQIDPYDVSPPFNCCLTNSTTCSVSNTAHTPSEATTTNCCFQSIVASLT